MNWNREREKLDQLYDDGLIDDGEYREEMREMDRADRDAALANAQDAYDRALDEYEDRGRFR